MRPSLSLNFSGVGVEGLERVEGPVWQLFTLVLKGAGAVISGFCDTRSRRVSWPFARSPGDGGG